ncbi:hypothetical protein H0264_28925 [Nocardia huaxiensis]|uniref:TraD/TraG TraM recognition site domain-containing protein n=1 Tax=Nocardia huaxiensis TaxID=2755382 RepID=A0A7D6V8E7_9NOCA|nr:hypothetical protein [Nocardia huaxiensis]QLY29274.1 hypothetical protein H0264_28925 [Nocardia huaxiensis]
MTGCKPMITPDDCGTTAPAVPTVEVPPPAPPPAATEVSPLPAQPDSPELFENPALPNGWQAPNWDLHLPSVAETFVALGTALLGLAWAVALGVGMNYMAHWRRWDARRVRNFALGSLVLPISAVWIANSWFASPALWWQGSQVLIRSGPGSGALVAMTAGCLPIAWGLAALWRARFLARLGTEGIDSPWKTRRLLRRQQQGQARAARRAAKYGAPLVTGWLKSRAVLGTLSERTDATQDTTVTQLVDTRGAKLEIPIEGLGHMFVLGKSQKAGKTTLLVRLGTGLYEAYWHRYVRTGEKRPLLIFVDCKGGKPGLATGRQVVKIAARHGTPAQRIALWPITSRFDLWAMNAEDQCATLESMINPVQAVDAGSEHFKQNRIRVVQLAVNAPVGKPKSKDDFLQRLSHDWLTKVGWVGHDAILAEIEDLQQNKPPAIGDVAGKFRNIFNAIGEGFEGGRPLDSFDVIYATVPGTIRGEYARAQVAALTTLISQFACGEHDRQIILIIDEMSAVADKTGGIGQFTIAERLLGMGVVAIFAAQNQYGLGQTPDERRRLMEGCPSGGLLMVQEGGGKVSEVFGTRPVTENTRHSKAGKVGEDGTLGNRETFFIDPNRLAEFDRGDVVWVHALKAQWGHVIPVDLDEVTALPADPYPQRWPGGHPRVPLKVVRDLESGRAPRADLGFDGKDTEGGEVA